MGVAFQIFFTNYFKNSEKLEIVFICFLNKLDLLWVGKIAQGRVCVIFNPPLFLYSLATLIQPGAHIWIISVSFILWL